MTQPYTVELRPEDVLGRGRIAPFEPEQQPRRQSLPTPILTYGLMFLITCVFGMELLFDPAGRSLTPSLSATLFFGGNIRELTFGHHEYFRLFTAIVLHSGIPHLLFNMIALFLVGRMLEALIGRLRFLAIFLFGGVAGSLVSLYWNPAQMVGVGASGAILACFATLAIIAFHFPSGQIRSAMLRSAIYVVVPSMLPVGSHIAGSTTDYAAHAGGLIAGVVLGGLFLVTWRQDAPRPGAWIPALAIAICGLLGVGAGVAVVGAQMNGNVSLSGAPVLAEEVEVERLWPATIGGAGDFTSAYPKDPRGHIGTGIYLLDQGKYPQAEAEARVALSRTAFLDILNPAVRIVALDVLAIAEAHQGRKDEALATAASTCGANEPLQRFVIEEGLCPASPASQPTH